MDQNRELLGKTILITGATDGIGRELAHMTWQAGATLVLHGRNPQKLAALLDSLGAGLPGQKASSIKADFSRLHEVKEMAAQILAEIPKIDILVNNAGLYPAGKVVTEDGFEECNQVNFLSPFLLTTLLRPLLITSAPMRIVNLSSIGHRFVWSNANPSTKHPFYWRWVAYCRSKLDIIPWTRELAEQLKIFGITVNCVHPGIIRTKVIRVLPVSWGASVHSGAETVYRLIADPDLAGVTGAYFERYSLATPSPMAQSRRYQAALWRHTLRRLRFKQEPDGSIIER
ncbi:MAG: SDR family NAD(P)-dependent oxidoreductase [Chloroflexi bacterium]|nr:SDR family NAD(P)-dependent oxidoreductase [Chloroflexota bacterium]